MNSAVPPTVIVPPAKDTRQESDLLEDIKPGKNCGDELTNAVRLVSLGCYCGPKLTFQQIGRGAETLPFDWIRTRLDGVLQLLRNDFAGFFEFSRKLDVPGAQMTCFRGPLHSFWHDDPTEPSMREKYTRRINRLLSIRSDEQPVLFVRTAGCNDEVIRASELLGQLEKTFGTQSKLLLILDFQRNPHGPFTVSGIPNLLLHLYCREAHDTSGLGPYRDAVLCGLDWAVGRPVAQGNFPSLEAAAQVSEPTTFGNTGVGGLPAFEDELMVSTPGFHHHPQQFQFHHHPQQFQPKPAVAVQLFSTTHHVHRLQ